MPLDNHIDDREYDKFEQTTDDLTAVRVKPFSGLLNGVSFDFIDAQQTDTVTETYVYKAGGAAGTTVATITVVYVDSTKVDLDTVTRT